MRASLLEAEQYTDRSQLSEWRGQWASREEVAWGLFPSGPLWEARPAGTTGTSVLPTWKDRSVMSESQCGGGGDLSQLPWKTDILIWLLFVTTTKPFSSLGHHMTWHLPYSLCQTSLRTGFRPRVEFLPSYSNQGAMISQENVYFTVDTFSYQFLTWLWLRRASPCTSGGCIQFMCQWTSQGANGTSVFRFLKSLFLFKLC